MIGQAVSHYRILEKIGSGGMGEIYLAEDTKLERKVALKFLPTELTRDPEARKRFEREAKAAAALNHPNIVTVHEIGEHEGQVFIAMEYVEGKTLREIISGDLAPSTLHPLPIPQVLDIAAQIASGLAAAHAKGIVHRDIKPQNIVIDKDGHVKILDFGLAKLKGVSPLTKESFTYGTVHYMSPEQALGGEVDPRSDIWSLGVVMYEMAGGGLPFRGEYDQAVIYSILNEEMPPLQAGIDDGLENIIRRCLAKKRQDRYPSAEALLAALRELDGTREAIHPDQSGGRRSSRRAILAALSLVLLFAIVGFFASTPKARATLGQALGLTSVSPSRHMAVLPFIAGGSTESRPIADGLMTIVTEKLTQLEKFHNSLWTVPASEILIDRNKSAQVLQRLWGCNLFISGNLQTDKNSLYLRLKLQDALTGRELNRVELQGHMNNLSIFQDGILSKIEEILELKKDPRASRDINAGGTAMPGAFILYLKGKGMTQSNAGMEQLDMGITFLEKSLKQDNGYIQARLSLAEALRFKFNLGRDPVVLQKALKQGHLAKQAARPWAPVQLVWALLLNESGEKTKALEALQETLRLNERCYLACIELAKVNAAVDRINEAEKLYKRAINLRPGYPSALSQLAYFYSSNGRNDEALVLYKEQARLAPGDFNTLINLGTLYQQKGDKANAKAMYTRSIAIQPNVTAQSNLATIFFYEGEYRKALPLFREAASNGNDCRWWGNLADTYRQLPEFKDKAAAAYHKAIAMAKMALTSTPDDAEFISALAMYYAHSGEKAKAVESITRAHFLAPADLETIRRAILVYEAVGERSQALDALREFRERLGSMEEIKREPDLANLQRDPEYLKIIRDLK